MKIFGSKGQVTIFIVIGIVLLSFMLFYITILQDDSAQIDNYFDTDVVYNYLQSCFKEQTKEALLIFGLQGGNIGLGYENGTITFNIRSYYDKGNLTLLDIVTIEDDLSVLSEVLIEFCLKNISFPGYNVKELDAPIVFARLADNNILFDIDYPIEIKKDNSRKIINDFNFELDVRLKKIILEVMNKILLRTLQYPDRIDYAYLADMNMTITIIPHEDNYLLYTIEDSESKIDATNDFNFIFALEFNPEEET